VNDSRRGLGYGAGAYLLWGLFPLYWPLLEPAGAVEILAHRIVWTVGVVFALLAFGGRWRQLAALRHDRRALLLLPASLLIAINWGSYIWGVNHARVVETSLGYFVNPLFTVLLGVLVLGERLRRTQWLAIGVGSTAVILLAVDYGHPPWVALTLAGSFGLYGLCKKTARVGAVESLTVETGVLFLPALG
jgi:chloramphenicol-sensitive protein RarD